MTLLDDFYQVVSQEPTDDGMKCQVRLNGQHFIYKAHFPGNPVTPGVCLVQMATELLQRYLQRRLSLAEITKIKYRNVVLPSDEPCFEFEHVEVTGNQCKARVRVSGGDKDFDQMSLVYDMA